MPILHAVMPQIKASNSFMCLESMGWLFCINIMNRETMIDYTNVVDLPGYSIHSSHSTEETGYTRNILMRIYTLLYWLSLLLIYPNVPITLHAVIIMFSLYL